MEVPQTIGRYEVERALGSGSVASVWLARDVELDAWVAVKVLAENWALDEQVREQFLEEARLLHRLDNPRFIRVMNVDNFGDGRPYFVMEFADGGSLQDRIDRTGDRPFSVADAIEISLELAECLIVAGDLDVVHRDLKPSNILYRTLPEHIRRQLEREGRAASDQQMVLGDFGLARVGDDESGSASGAGTRGYMAPEQAHGIADHRSDIYSAAAILHHLVVGRPPEPGLPIAAHPAIDDALETALADDPYDRPGTAEEWRDLLASVEVASDATAAATAIARPQRRRGATRLRRRRLRTTLGAVVLVGASAATGVIVWNAVDPDSGVEAIGSTAAAPLAFGESRLGEVGTDEAHLLSLAVSADSEFVITLWSETASLELDVFDPEGRLIDQLATSGPDDSTTMRVDASLGGQYTLRVRSGEATRYALGAIGGDLALGTIGSGSTTVPTSASGSDSIAQFRAGVGRSSAYATSSLTGIPYSPLIRSETEHFPPVAAGDTVVIAQSDGTLHAVQQPSGITRWVRQIGTGAHGSPAIRDGLVFVPTLDGVHCIRLDSGETVWSTSIDSMSDRPALLTSDLFLVVADDSLVVALDPSTGATLWQHRLGSRIVDLIAIHDLVIAAADNDEVVAIDDVTGLPAWSVTTASPPGYLLSDGTSVFVSTESALEARSPVDGAIQWMHEQQGRPTGPPAMAYGMIYLASQSGSGARLSALAPGFGAQLCQSEIGCELWSFFVPGGIVGGPTVIGRDVVFFRGNGSVSSVDALLACQAGAACREVSLFAEGDLTNESTVTVGDGFFVISDASVMAVLECPLCSGSG